MHIVRVLRPDGSGAPGVRDHTGVRLLGPATMAELLRLTVAEVQHLTLHPQGPAVVEPHLVAPLDGRTEVWASGVTYARSREARLEESRQRSVYALVYDAERPELFFKSAAWRVVTDGGEVAIRADSTLDVPEPELALVLTAAGETLGYLVANDMSSRSIEGENPLYLPQAKMYAGACALSTGIRPVWEVPDARALRIGLRVERDGVCVMEDETSTAAMHREFSELVDHLFRAENFPDGAILATGTGIVPSTDFTLRVGDEVSISIDEVGSLHSHVVMGAHHFQHLAQQSADDDPPRSTP